MSDATGGGLSPWGCPLFRPSLKCKPWKLLTNWLKLRFLQLKVRLFYLIGLQNSGENSYLYQFIIEDVIKIEIIVLLKIITREKVWKGSEFVIVPLHCRIGELLLAFPRSPMHSAVQKCSEPVLSVFSGDLVAQAWLKHGLLCWSVIGNQSVIKCYY